MHGSGSSWHTSAAWLLLDALDEVPDDLREALRRSLHSFAERHPRSRLLLTSRIVGYGGAPVEGLQELELVGFNSEQQKTFIRVWYTGTPDDTHAQSAGLEELLAHQAPLRGLAQVPLMLWMLCQAHSMGDVTVPMRRVELYGQCLTGLLGKWAKQKDQPQSQVEPSPKERAVLEAKVVLLASMALQWFAQNRELFTIGEVARWLEAYYDGLPTRNPLKVAWQARSSADMLEELCREDGILIEAGQGEDTPLMFLHLTFQEFLAAKAIASAVDGQGWDTEVDVLGKKVKMCQLVNSQAWNPRWQEVIVLLAGQLHDPVPLLTWLTDTKHDDLFRHRLALAALCLPELPLPRSQELSVRVDHITTITFSLWWEYWRCGTEVAVPHLTRVLPALGYANGRVPSSTVFSD